MSNGSYIRTFTVRTTQSTLNPVRNAEFVIGTSHSYGLFIRSSGLDPNLEEIVRSDAMGKITFSYTPKFTYPTKDTYGFGVGPSPKNEAFVREFQEREDKGIDRVGEPYGPTFDVVIYPRWLSFFKLK